MAVAYDCGPLVVKRLRLKVNLSPMYKVRNGSIIEQKIEPTGLFLKNYIQSLVIINQLLLYLLNWKSMESIL